VQHEAAQRGEEDSTQRVEAPPWLRSESVSMMVTQTIFAINVIVFVAMAFAGVSITEPSGKELVRWGANLSPYTVGGQWWRLLTCVFVHVGILHIAFNMWCLWDLGQLAESLYGHWTFGAVYLITGIAASVTSAAWHPIGPPSAGASGAIFGIAGALIASFYLGEFSLPRAALTGTLRSVVMFVGYNLFFGAVSHGIDNAAHIGGLVSGLVLGALIARVAPHRDEPLRRIGVLLVGVLLVGFGVQWLQHARSYLVHAQSGASLLGENKTDEAIHEFQTSLRMRKDFVPARLELARAYILKGDLTNAENELQTVIATNPRNEDAYYFLGHVYLEEKQPEQARKIFAEMIKISPSNADGHAGLAEVASFENKYADAVEEYKRTAQLDPGYQSVYHDLGLMQSKLRLYDDAIASFLQQREKGDDPENELALAQAYEAKGMTREAVEAKQRAARFQGQE
jgi:membrane associated rhomboid family serine protease/Tfp pilus assembly protein PilF